MDTLPSGLRTGHDSIDLAHARLFELEASLGRVCDLDRQAERGRRDTAGLVGMATS